MVGTYLDYLIEIIQNIDLNTLKRVVQHLREAREHNAMVFIMGNGGSAATASHFANDLGKGAKKYGGSPVRVMYLSDCIPWFTALANDDGYENIFSGQLENHLQSRDVVIVMSASGNSENLVRAVEFGKAKRALTVGIVGFDGGKLKVNLWG